MTLLLLACTSGPTGEKVDRDDSTAGEVTMTTRGEISLVETLSCEAPAPLTFTNRAAMLGLRGADHAADHFEGGVAALDDSDRDGVLDLRLGLSGAPLRRYAGLGSGRAATEFHVPGPMSWLRFDLDEDGESDLLFGGTRPETWLWRDGALVPQPMPSWFDLDAMLPRAEGGAIKQLVPFDLEGDGDLDLHVALNNRLDAPADATEDTLLVHDGPRAWHAVPLDATIGATRAFDAAVVDRDGTDALYIANDMGAAFGGNQLLIGRDGTLIDATATCACGAVESAMADTVADVDGDGRDDLVVGSTWRTLLLLGQPDGTYVDASSARGVDTVPDGYGMSWGVSAIDLDNDGRRDLVVPQGDLRANGSAGFESPVNLLWQREDGTFEDRGAELGFPQAGSHRATLPWDVNRDGVLDVLVTQVDAAPTWLVSDGCTAMGWLEVDAPEGSRVRVEVGDRVWTGRATADVSYGATAPPRVHIGLGEGVELVDRVRVITPGGRVHEADNVPARSRLAVEGAAFSAWLSDG